MKFEDKVMLAIMMETVANKEPKEAEVHVKISKDGITQTEINASLLNSVVCVAELIKGISKATEAEPEEVIRTVGFGLGVRF